MKKAAIIFVWVAGIAVAIIQGQLWLRALGFVPSLLPNFVCSVVVGWLTGKSVSVIENT